MIEGSKTMESFSITTSSKADRIQIAYGLAGTAPKNCTIVVVTEEVTPIDGLTEATTYFVFARGVRGENDYSEWSEPLSVTTACGDIVITRDAPYIENFDTYGEMVVPFPPCVNKVTVQDLEGLSYPMLSTVKSVSEPHALLLRGVSMLALPKFVDENGNAIDLSKTVLSFDVVGSTSSGSGSAPFAVGLLDKLGDDATFIDLGERLLLASNESSLTAREDRMHYEVDLTLDDVIGEYFAFRTDATFEPGYVYIDNIEVKLAPTCYEPRALKTTLVMDTALAFEWTAAPDAKRFYYELYQGSMLLDEHKGEVEETNITFKDLLPDYTYTLYVSTICDDAGEEITKSSKIKVQTHRRFGRIPYEYGFEDSDMGDVAADWYRLGATWGEGSGNNPFVIDTKATSSDSKERFGEKSLYVTDMMNSVNTEYGRYAYDGTFWATTSYAYRTFYLEPGKYSISYDWKANGRTIGSEWEDVECGRVFFVSTSYEIKDNEPKKDAVNQNNEGSSFMIPDGAIVLDNGQNLTAL